MSGIRTTLLAVSFFLFSNISGAASLTMVSELSVKPELASEFLTWITADLELSRKSKGNLQFDIYIDPYESGKFLFIERWESKELQTEYINWRSQRGDYLKMQDYLLAPPKMSTYLNTSDN
ncbi:putative quinol monooxygenase [Aurantivibrio infirmus]